MSWHMVLGLIGYIVIICCLTVWFTRNHNRKRRLGEENSGAEAQDKPDGPDFSGHKARRD
jgi:hypothetical protein